MDEYSDAYYLEQAEKLGIADPSYYDDLTADMNHEQFFTMLKKAHDLQYGEDSNCLIDGWLYYMTEGENQWEGKEPIPLGRVIDVAAMADAVYFRGVERDFTQDFWGAMDGLWEEADLPKCNEYLWESHHMPIGVNEEGILFAFHYYRSLYPEPEYVNIADVGTYDPEIITEDLLNKETPLPQASNQKIPGEWHGIGYDYQNGTWGALSGQSDWFMNERDFQEMHDSGFNMVRIWTSWYQLLSPYLNTPNQVRLDRTELDYKKVVNLKELEYWDQLLAWAMEYDIHIQICFTDTPGLDISVYESGWDDWFTTEYCTGEIFKNEEVQQVSAEW